MKIQSALNDLDFIKNAIVSKLQRFFLTRSLIPDTVVFAVCGSVRVLHTSRITFASKLLVFSGYCLHLCLFVFETLFFISFRFMPHFCLCFLMFFFFFAFECSSLSWRDVHSFHVHQ